MLEKFIKTYSGEYKYTTMIRHQGVVIAFAMDTGRHIWYTVLDLGGSSQELGSTEQPKSVLDVDAWQQSPTELIFPNEIAEVGFGVADQTILPVFEKNASQPRAAEVVLPPGSARDDFQSTTARFTEDAPFTILSDGRYVYVFRQAIADGNGSMVYLDESGNLLVDRRKVGDKSREIGYVVLNKDTDKNNEKEKWIAVPADTKITPLVDSTLLVDRFLLVGSTLTPKMEVRYQRSRSKTRPASRKDSLGPKDLDGNIFYEPTRELKFIGNLTGGHFSVLLLPTAIAEVERWQIFAENSITHRMDLYNVERSKDGLFNTRGSQTLAGIEHTSFEIEGRVFKSAPTSLFYYQQSKAASGYSGEAKPLKNTGRVMLAVATNNSMTEITDEEGSPKNHIAALDFGVSATGRLAQIPNQVELSLIDAMEAADQPLNDRLDNLRNLQALLEDAITYKQKLEDELENACVQVYQHAYYDGASHKFGQCLINDLAEYNFDNLISSIRIDPPLEVVAYEDPSMGGKSITYTQDTNWVGNDWNDMFSSLEIREKSSFKQQRNDAQKRVDDTRAELTALEKDLREVGTGASVTMPRVHTDPLGLTISAGLLDFAWTNAAPLLFDSATGKLALYFRGGNDQFFVAYYDTFTERASIPLGAVTCYARSMDYPKVTIKISNGTGEDTCCVEISTENGETGAIVETWRNLPRSAAELAKVLNGQATGHTYIGSWSKSNDGELTLSHAVERPAINKGATLMVGDVRITVKEQVLPSDLRISYESKNRLLEEVLPVFLLEYDYSDDASCAGLPVDLSNGSALILALAGEDAVAMVPNLQNVELIPMLVCKWTAAAPGTTLAFDGKTQFVEASDLNKLRGFDAPGDLTLEAWMKPTRVDGSACVIQHYSSSDTQYTLKLEENPLMSALRLDGETGYVTIPKAEVLDFPGAITIEAWIKPDNFDGTRDIVAHGYPDTSTGIVFLRMKDGHYEVGTGFGADSFAALDIPADDLLGNWVHLAGVYDAKDKQWRLYRNGVQVAVQNAEKGACQMDSQWAIGANPDPELKNGDRHLFQGSIDDIRIWKRARIQREIQADMNRRLFGAETDLVGYWYREDDQVKDHSRYGNNGTIIGEVLKSESPLSAYIAIAGAGGKFIKTKQIIPAGNWTHFAAAYRRAYGLSFNGIDDYLDCGNAESLNINGDLTIDVSFQVDDLSEERVILERGTTGEPAGQKVPYRLSINTKGKIVFKFWDVEGHEHPYESKASIETGRYHYVMVTRKRKTITYSFEQDAKTPGLSLAWDDITMYVDSESPSELLPNCISIYDDNDDKLKRAIMGLRDSPQPSPTNDTLIMPIKNYTPEKLMPREVGRSDGSLLIGKASSGSPFQGTIMSLRIWNTAQTTSYFPSVAIDSRGLVSWWRFEERKGSKTNDACGTNHAELKGDPKWVTSPDPQSSSLNLYVDGQLMATDNIFSNPGIRVSEIDQFTLGARKSGDDQFEQHFQGELEEVRIWQTTRTQEQIQDNLFCRIPGEKADLIAYYTFDAETDGQVSDHSLRDNHLTVKGEANYVLSTAPIGEDTPQVRSALAGIRTSFSGTIQSTPAVQEYGDMQYDSQGNLIGVFKRCYSFILDGHWKLITGYKVGDMVTEWIGQVQFAPQLMGYIEGAPPVPCENLTTLDSTADYNEASSVELVEVENTAYNYASSRDTGFDMSVGSKLGFMIGTEANVGFGVVVKSVDVENIIGLHTQFDHSLGWLDSASTGTSLTTGKSTLLTLRGHEESGKGSGSHFLPENIGMAVVKSETADVFALRLQHNGALIAYQMRPNPDIPKDWNIIHFPINPHYTKQGTLDGKIGLSPDPDYPNALTYSPNSSYFKPVEAYGLKNRIKREEIELKTLFDQYEAGSLGRRQKYIHYTEGDLAAGRMLDKLPNTYKHNLINTYVWTADGGLFAETQEMMDSWQETIGGSYTFKGMAGLYADLKLALFSTGAKFEADAIFGGHLNLTVNKTQNSSSSYRMNINLDKVERDLYWRDENGVITQDLGDPLHPKPRKQPGKVDAYRFMSFYLEPLSDHFDDFFNQVVDPTWLESRDPGAVALCSARDDNQEKKPAPWRVMHRVTYVSRVLPPLDPFVPPSLEKTLQTLDIDSNYELIKQMEPYVRDHLASFVELSDAVDQAIKTYLPELLPHKREVKEYLSLYYGMEDGYISELQPEVSGDGAESVQRVNNIPPTVVFDQNPPVLLLNGVSIDWKPLTTRVHDDRLIKVEDLFLTWEFIPADMQGPGDVVFDNPHILGTTVTFRKKGRYHLRLTASDGLLSASDETVITVNETPKIESITALGEPEQRYKGDSLCWDVNLRCRVISGLGNPAEYTGLTKKWTILSGFPNSMIGSIDVVPDTADQGVLICTTPFTFYQSGYYLLKFTVGNGAEASSEKNLEIAARVTEGLQVLYTFKTNGGPTVYDVSGALPPLDLNAPKPDAVTWVPCGMVVRSAAVVSAKAARLTQAIRSSNAITLEAWIKPLMSSANLSLRRILTLSSGPAERNFILAQKGNTYHLGLRTTAGLVTDANASLRSLEGGAAGAGLTHIVFTRDEYGNARLYQDAALVAERTISGDFSGWDEDFQLALGNELLPNGLGGWMWPGEYRLVAIYSRALRAEDVQQNFDFGPDRDLPPKVFAGEDQEINWSAEGSNETDKNGNLVLQLQGRVTHDRPTTGGPILWEQVDGPAKVRFANDASPVTMAYFPTSGKYRLRLTAEDDIGQMVSQEVVLTITHETPVVGINFPDKKLIVTPLGVNTVTLTGREVSLQLSCDVRNSCKKDYPAAKRTIEWTCTPAGAVLDDPSRVDPVVTFTHNGVYELKLTATNTDEQEKTGSASVQITVNQPPVVDAGPNQETTKPEGAILDATLSDDGFPLDPGVLELTWTDVSEKNPDKAIIKDPKAAYTKVSFPRQGTYKLRLSANDGAVTVQDEVTIIVKPVPSTPDSGDKRKNRSGGKSNGK